MNDCSVLEGFLQGRVTMAGVLHFILLLLLHCGSFFLISARPDEDTMTVRSTVDSDAAFTTTESLYPAGKTNTTQVSTTRFPTSYSKSTTKPPKTTTTTEHLAEDTEEEEGPLELGKCVIFYILYVGIVMVFL